MVQKRTGSGRKNADIHSFFSEACMMRITFFIFSDLNKVCLIALLVPQPVKSNERRGKERPVHHSCGHPRRSPCSCWRKDGYRIPEGEGGRIFKAGEKRSGLAVRTSVSLHCQTGCYCGSPAIENAATESGNGKESCRPAGRSVPAVFFTAVSCKTFPPPESPDTAPWRSRRESGWR